VSVQVTVRYFAGARSAAGTPQESLELPGELSVGDLSDELAQRHGPALGRVLAAASFLVDEVAATADRQIEPGSCVDVLPPFAGG
jgi:molybdopterin synthase sulfur carrier subunit